jgi:hypothetical protein
MAMFGYVMIYKDELKVKDYNTYKAFYCGLCRSLQKTYGLLGQGTLTYDMTFFVILMTSLYETETEYGKGRCVVHPVKKQHQWQNEMSRYAADMNIMLAYYHFKDDWEDEKNFLGLMGKAAFERRVRKLHKIYPRLSEVISQKLKQLKALENANETGIDRVSGLFGEIMGELFVYQEDQWSSTLRTFGQYLGKFVYLMDAYDDLQQDIKNNNYNPLKVIYETRPESYELMVKDMLLLLMAEASEAFEKLPCITYVDILRNILYVGVWQKYDKIQLAMKGEKDDN